MKCLLENSLITELVLIVVYLLNVGLLNVVPINVELDVVPVTQ